MDTAKNILLIDCSFMSFLAEEFRRHFGKILGRELGDADLQAFLTLTAIDCGYTSGSEVEVILAHRKGDELRGFDFSDLDELNGKAFKNQVGEFGLTSVSAEGFTTLDDFYCDCLRSLLDADGSREIGVVCDYERYGETVCEILEERNGKTVTLFHVNPLDTVLPYHTTSIGFAMMKSLGIRGDELR